jgi:hypothetical protein
MNNKSIKTLKAIVILVAVGVFLLEALLIYPLSLRYAYRVPSYSGIRIASLVFLYITSIPFYMAIFQALRICNNIIENKPFAKSNIYYFDFARWCALPVAIAYLLGGIGAYIFTAGRGTPAMTLIVAMAAVSFFALIVFLACSVMVELFKRAHELQEENAMTI